MHRAVGIQRMHTPFSIFEQTAPGGVGSIVGEKELPPPGPTNFSVGEGTTELDAGAEVVAEVVGGASFSVVGLHAVSVPAATNAVPPAMIAIRRVRRPELMVCPFV
jgi:hypothetical protein